MKNKRWFLALMWLMMLPILACATLTGGDEATEAPAATLEVATVAIPTEAPPPMPTTDPTAGFVNYDNPDIGLAFRYPADWFVDDVFFVTVGSSQELVTGDETNITEGAVMALIPSATTEFGGGEPVALLTSAADEFALGGEQQEISEPVATTIQGQPAAVATVAGTTDGGTELEGQMAVIVNGEWTVLVAGVTPSAGAEKDDYLATMDAILRTVVVSEPQGGEIQTPEIELPPVPSEVVPVTVGDRHEGVVPESGVIDHAITLVQGEPVTIAGDPEDELDLVLEIFEAGDLVDPLRSVDDAFNGEIERIVFAAPADGDYTIRVRGFAGAGGSYTLTIDPGGSISQSEELIPMTLQTPYEDEMGGEPASYLLTLTGDQSIPVVLVPNTEDQDLVLEVYDMFGNQVARADDGFSGDPEGLVIVPEADGDYEVRVSAFGANEGGYLLFAFDPDLGLQTAGEVAPDAEVNYRMCVPAGASLLAMATPEEGFDLTLSLLGPGGGILVDEVDNALGGEPEVVFYTDGADSTEPYPIIVSVAGWASGSGGFTLLITSTGETPVVQDGC